MGRDKATLDVAGVRAVDRLVALAVEVGAATVLTVGGEDYGHPHVDDPVPLGGPVGGIVAGAAALTRAGCTRALVLAVDAPTLRTEDIVPLFGPADGGVYTDQPLPFVALLRRFPAIVGSDWPVKRLVGALYLQELSIPAGAVGRLKGANTPEEYEVLAQAFTAARAEASR